MHLLSLVFLAEATLCICGVAAMMYWGWRALPEPADDHTGVNFPLGLISRRRTARVSTWRYHLVKRFVDFTMSLLLLIAFAVPGCVIAVLILLTSRGPIFYSEKRIGQYGNLFRIWKFRSMHTEAEMRNRMPRSEDHQAHFFRRMSKCESDPRITTIGHFLRRWSLDEVPQLFNVIIGDMSLIGPRPIVESEVTLYGEEFEHYVEAKPGLSGLWQVSGRSNIGYRKRADLEAHYVRTWSLKADVKILALTVPAVLKRIGAK